MSGRLSPFHSVHFCIPDALRLLSVVLSNTALPNASQTQATNNAEDLPNYSGISPPPHKSNTIFLTDDSVRYIEPLNPFQNQEMHAYTLWTK